MGPRTNRGRQEIVFTLRRLAWISLVVLILFSAAAWGMDTRVDPRTKRIRSLLAGLPVGGWAGWAEVFLFAMDDPRFDVRATVPHLGLATPETDLVYARRVARIYLPRTYQYFVENTDLVLLANVDLRIFTPENIAWFRDGVRDEGLGLLMTGGSQGFGGYGGFPSWGDTVLDEILPVNCQCGEQSKSYLPKLKVADPNNELARSIPWEEAPCFFPYNFVTPREGCQLVIVSDDDRATPLWFYWDVGKGRFVGCQNIFGVFGCEFNRWAYFQDSVLNTYYFTVAFPLPRDLGTVHELRRKWEEYRLSQKLLLSLIEFADAFGARMRHIEDRMAAVQTLRESSDGLYLDGDYVGALETIDEAISETKEVSDLAIEAKEQALFWVYAIEWLLTTGTLIMSGSLVWTLMVKRATYREVASTRRVS